MFSIGTAPMACKVCMIPIPSVLLGSLTANRGLPKHVLRLVIHLHPPYPSCTKKMSGAYCRGVTTSLTWDKPSPGVQDARSDGAGCGSNNRCSKPPYGSKFQCDEYPFKSTKNADNTIAVNRCVPGAQNSRMPAMA